ncbi:hypothetical protein AD006_31435 (plasmid) [Pseudonocardia sp. EC080610-09]|nr:hypothetical protein AD006_31435 [Pseudonocardia sp. EC080610-09]
MSTAFCRHPAGWVAGVNPSPEISRARAWAPGSVETVRSVSRARVWVRVSRAAASWRTALPWLQDSATSPSCAGSGDRVNAVPPSRAPAVMIATAERRATGPREDCGRWSAQAGRGLREKRMVRSFVV